MGQIIGFLLIFALIVGGLLSTGADAVIAALPFELALIGGAAFATLLIGNAPAIVRDAIVGLGLAVMGSRWKRNDFTDLLVVLHRTLSAWRKHGAPGIDADLQSPDTSALLSAAPRLLKDDGALIQFCEGMRTLAASGPAPGVRQSASDRVAAQLEQSLLNVQHRRMQAVGALQTVADALPALGIVAAVLGIIKTMSAIDESNAVIGAMIATALLGTFLGVFLAYGLVGPLANRFGQVVDDEMLALSVIATAISNAADGAAPRLAVEAARMVLPNPLRPPEADLDARLAAGPDLRLVSPQAA